MSKKKCENNMNRKKTRKSRMQNKNKENGNMSSLLVS